ncbi:MAG TPA: response regulator [Candidatus Omnitrophota bacterium]|nr:response regulator [Candidatus Omnitrophota bacterium]
MRQQQKEKPIEVLLVEDSETDVKIILRAFEKQKFSCHVHRVVNGEEALAYLQHKEKYQDRHKYPDPDIILLDIHMPRMDGHTFVRELRRSQEKKEIPIIVFTMKEGMKDIFRIEGVNDYVVKTIDGLDLIGKIKEVLQFKKEFFGND